MSERVPVLVVIDTGISLDGLPLHDLDDPQVLVGPPSDDTSFVRRPDVVVIAAPSGREVRVLARAVRTRLPRAALLALIPQAGESSVWVEVGVTIDDFEVIEAPPRRLEARIRGLAALHGRENRSDLLVRNIRMMAHDVNNPLTVVRILADVLGGENLSDDAKQDLADILEATDTAGRLVDGMSAWAKLVNGQDSRESRTPLDLAGVLQRLTSQPAFSRGVLLGGIARPTEISAAPREIERAMSDLLMNGRRLAQPGRPVSVSLSQVGDFAEVRLKPDGLKLDRGLVRYLGDPYGQVFLRDSKLPTACFGLAGPRIVAERLGGSMEFREEPDGAVLVWRVRMGTGL